jgi:hypothetical protein
MNLESLLVYGLVAAGGWLVRHVGIGSGFSVPGLPRSTPAPTTATNVPVMATLKTDIDQIVKSAVEAAVKQTLDDIKGVAVPQSPAKS